MGRRAARRLRSATMIEQLRVPDATLYVDRRGSGPTLLLVAGGSPTRLLLPA